MSGNVEIKSDEIQVKMKKKRNLPALLTVMEPLQRKTISILGNRKLILTGDTTS